MTAQLDSGELLAEKVATANFSDLSPEVVKATKLSILDTFAVMIAGTNGVSGSALLDIAAFWGGNPQSGLCGSDLRVCDTLAAFVNGGLIHQLDFDDTHDLATCHPTSIPLASALAVAEASGNVTGEKFITAMALGIDVATRLALSIKGQLWDYSFSRTRVVGLYGGVAAASHVLGLSTAETFAGFGIALPQTGGTLESATSPGSCVREIRDGLSARDAVLAVRFAQRGLSGDARTFDGPYGLFEAYFRGEYDRDIVLEDLRGTYHGSEVSIKPWPSCRPTHATISAFFECLDAAGDGAEPRAVRIKAGKALRHFCEDIEWPTSRIDALRHLPFIMATSMVYGEPRLSDFDTERFTDPRVLDARSRLSWQLDDTQNRFGAIEPGNVEVDFADGRTIAKVVDIAVGNPGNPMSAERMRAKLEDCYRYASYEPGLSADELMAAVEELDKAPDITSLVRALAPLS